MPNLKKQALVFIVLLGIVSLFADFTYEGARSITGPFLALLGASSFAVGVTVGFGELVGYAIRFFSGYLADRTKAYWLLVIISYVINLLAVPMLALAENWQQAVALIILERFGKGIRTPARDAMLSFATKQVGRGWGFGLHESLDQIGAIVGPFLVLFVLYFNGSYRLAFALLAIPAALSLISLFMARVAYPRPERVEKVYQPLQTKGYPRAFWIYLLAIGCVAAGFSDFAFISYHFQKAEHIPQLWIPALYAIAMGADGLSALLCGRLFDRFGLILLAAITAVTAFFAPFVYLGGFTSSLIGVILWGVGMGVHESIMRAQVAHYAPPEKRGAAYGLLNLGFGLFWFFGSSAMGYLYQFSLVSVVIFSLALQLASVPLFLWLSTKK